MYLLQWETVKFNVQLIYLSMFYLFY